MILSGHCCRRGHLRQATIPQGTVRAFIAQAHQKGKNGNTFAQMTYPKCDYRSYTETPHTQGSKPPCVFIVTCKKPLTYPLKSAQQNFSTHPLARNVSSVIIRWRRKKSALRRYGVFSGPRHTRCMPSPLKTHQAL